MARASGTAATSGSVNRCRFAALSLGVLGAVGLGLGVASQIDSAWSGEFQAGTTFAETDCQDPTIPVVGGFSEMLFAPNAQNPFQPGGIQFTQISTECVGHDFQVAYREDAEWMVLAQGTVAGPTVTVPLDIDSADIGSDAEFAIAFTKD